MVRPNFEQSRPAALIERDDEGEVEAEAGNTELEPYRADNFDLAVEFYPGDASVLSAGVLLTKEPRNQPDRAALDLAGSPPFEGFDVFSSFYQTARNAKAVRVRELAGASNTADFSCPPRSTDFLVAANLHLCRQRG